MNQLLKAKRNFLVTAAAIGAAVAIAACSNSDTLGPTAPASGPSSTSSTGGSKDTTHTGGGGGGTSGPGKDTSATHPPAPKPVEKFTLTVHVGSVLPTSTDTLADDPIAGAPVTVSRRTYERTGNAGSDSLRIVDTPIGSAATDANGNASFAGLKGTDSYAIKVDGPSGSGYASATTSIYQAYFDKITVHMVLRKQ